MAVVLRGNQDTKIGSDGGEQLRPVPHPAGAGSEECPEVALMMAQSVSSPPEAEGQECMGG